MSKLYYQVDTDKYTVQTTTTPDVEAYFTDKKQAAYRYLFNQLPKSILNSEKGRDIEREAFPAPLYYSQSQSCWTPTYSTGDYIKCRLIFLEEQDNPETVYFAIDFQNLIIYQLVYSFVEEQRELFYTNSKENPYLRVVYSENEDEHFKNLCMAKGLSIASKQFQVSDEWRDTHNPSEFQLL